MFSALLANFTLLVTLTYLFSLTLRSWPLPRGNQFQLQSAVLVAVMSVLLILQPAEIRAGIIIDMRAVPLAYLALTFGGPTALLASLPVLLYRTYLGGPGVIPAYLSLLFILLVASYIGRHWNFEAESWPRRILLATLMFMPNSLPIMLLPGGIQLIQHSYLPLLVMNTGGFLIAFIILSDRLRLMRLNTHFQHQAHQDALSGLANRRQFDLDLPKLRPGDLLLMADIDHFKRINDTYGHAGGDQVIAAVADILRGSLRVSDRAYRYGGEEFALIIRAPQLGTPEMIAERIRINIAGKALRLPVLEGQEPIHLQLTLSLGGARHETGRPPKQTLSLADQRLYQAKQQGRNCWVLDEEPAQGRS